MKGWLRGRPRGVIAFLIICALVAGGLGWATSAALGLEEEQHEARRAADRAERRRLRQREQEQARQARQREREQQEKQARDEFDGRLRLALWRLDSRIVPVLAREDTRPYNHYSAVFAPTVVLDPKGNRFAPATVLEPSPLLNADLPEWMLLHFQTAPGSGWGSPQVLATNYLKQLHGNGVDARNVTSPRRELLRDLSSAATSQALLERVRKQELQMAAVPDLEAVLDGTTNTAQNPGINNAKQPQDQQKDSRRDAGFGYGGRAMQRYQTTQEGKVAPSNDDAYTVVTNMMNYWGPWGAPGKRPLGPRDHVLVRMGPMTPFWLPAADGQARLVLARRVRVTSRLVEDLAVASAWPRSGGPAVLALVSLLQCKQTHLTLPRDVAQGVVLDWPRLQKLLADEVRDLFPSARLLPMRAEGPPHPERTMTALPVEVDPGEGPEVHPAPNEAEEQAPLGEVEAPRLALGWTPLRIGLVLAWAAALVALAAVGLGGWSLLDLSERRIRFVSAVTHELRSPLTTLHLYLDMLTGGLVRDEERKTEYLETLHTETDRLTRLVSNVLDFSRLEKQDPRLVQERVEAADLLGQVAATWQTRCHDGEKELVVEDQAGAGAGVLTDVQLVQQILGNLIDNACKYSRGADDRRIWLRARRAESGRLALEVEDRGPGVPPRERRAIFKAFCRGRSADVTAGGVGLGLALAQRWARLLGGSLTLCSPTEGGGACFRLELPLAPPESEA